jgi:hypothetical protein
MSWLKSNSFYENYLKKTPEALECTHILGTTAEQVVVKWSNARPGWINFRQMPAYTEVIVSQMPGGCPGGDDRGWIWLIHKPRLHGTYTTVAAIRREFNTPIFF